MMNPLQVIVTKSLEHWSGCIEIEEPKDSSISWLVYLLEGRIQYASTTAGQQIRLDYLWQRYNLGSDSPKIISSQRSEYFQLSKYLAERQLSEETIKSILFNFCQESLTHIGTIEETNVNFIPYKRISNSIFYSNVTHLQLQERTQAWQPLRNYLGTPFTRLYLRKENALKFYKLWQILYTNPKLKSLAASIKLSSFAGLFINKSTLYEIATIANIRTYLLAMFLKQCVEKNIVELFPFDENKVMESSNQKRSPQLSTKSIKQQTYPQIKLNINDKSALILCIDDSKTVQKQIKMTLESVGYQVVSIFDPYTNLNKIYQYQPAVVFMDINMPKINGYELCSLLKKSQQYKNVPIVMLTGRDGAVDRVRAKLAGAAEYITKPCQPEKLISLVTMLQPSNEESIADS